ncbi:MAG TPA: PadR family transcriptional regulator [Actinomycetota bacterium]|nr:PadR family transcriptional regulator [Actinomycetota bacterium]
MIAPAQDEAARRELARGTVELAILALLSRAPTYGYDLLSTLNEITGGTPEVKEGTVYPILHRLEDSGFVSASWEAQGRNAPRKYYAITKDGKARLSSLRTEWDRLVGGMSRLLDGGKR